MSITEFRRRIVRRQCRVRVELTTTGLWVPVSHMAAEMVCADARGYVNVSYPENVTVDLRRTLRA